MSALQTMIDELEARANVLADEISLDEQELLAKSAALQLLSKKLDEKRERMNHYRFAASNIREAEGVVVTEMLNPASAPDPWGDAG